MYPKEFADLVSMFEKLPGVGAKSSQRYAFALLNLNQEEKDQLVQVITATARLKPCPRCGFLSNGERCEICADETRDQSSIMVVSYIQDVVAIEKTGTYHGLYHVLNGVISSSKGVFPEDLNIDGLLKRIDDSLKEVIIATSPTMDGEMTALYLDRILKDKNLLVTRLANGLPMGASLDYADDLTLIKALANRRKIED